MDKGSDDTMKDSDDGDADKEVPTNDDEGTETNDNNNK